MTKENPFVISDNKQFIRKIEQLDTQPDTSFALVFVMGNKVEEADVKVLRAAVKMCDKVIMATNTIEFSQGIIKQLKQIGVDVVFGPKKGATVCKLDAMVCDFDATFVLQSITLSFANVVFIRSDAYNLEKVYRNIANTFGEICALRKVNIAE